MLTVIERRKSFRASWQFERWLTQPPRPIFTLLLAGLLLLSGCTAQNLLIKAPTPDATKMQAAPATTDQAQAVINRLLVLGDDGNLFTVKPDGSATQALTTDANRALVYAQPTWSPTGEHIGWARLEQKADEVVSALVVSRADGREHQQFEVPFPPFYLNWSPDGAQLAYLSNWVGANQQTIALRLVNVATGNTTVATLGTGQPFYFSWAPDGKQMLTHIDNERTALLALDGTETLLAAKSANFATPQWAGVDGKLLYELENEGKPQLVIADATGAIAQVVTDVKQETMLNFSMNAKGSQLAYTETDHQVGLNSLGPLFLFNVKDESFQQLSADPVVAFFWSPDGHALLFMSADIEDEQIWLQLQVWDGQTTRPLSRFIPSPLFVRQYLPFADQYAQSIQVWSPDSSAVVFAGQNEAEKTGIWVQKIDGKSPAQHVADGVFATWSPR